MAASIVLADRWPWVALQAALAVVFGLVLVAGAGAPPGALLSILGVFAVALGGASLSLAARRGTLEPRWTGLGVEGVVGVALGAVALASPIRTPAALAVVGGVWAALGGAARLGAGLRLSRQIAGEWLLGVAGAISVAVGLAVLVRFRAPAPETARWLAADALASAAALGLLATRLRTWRRGRTPALAPFTRLTTQSH